MESIVSARFADVILVFPALVRYFSPLSGKSGAFCHILLMCEIRDLWLKSCNKRANFGIKSAFGHFVTGKRRGCEQTIEVATNERPDP